IYREALAVALARSPATQIEAADAFRQVLMTNPFDVSAWRTLRQIFATQGDTDKVYCLSEVLNVLRAAEPEERRFYLEHRDKVGQMSKLELSDAEHAAWILDPGWRGAVGAIFAVLSDQLAKVYPADVDGLDLKDRLTAKSADPLRIA